MILALDLAILQLQLKMYILIISLVFVVFSFQQ
jgi:hypothetical protein